MICYFEIFRDFVNVRRYQKQDNLMILAGKATLYEAIQERKGMIRYGY